MEVTPSENPCSFPEAISRYDGLYPATGYSVEPLPEAIMSAESTYESYVQSVRAFLGGISSQSARSRFSAQRATRLWRQLVQHRRRRRAPPGLDLESGFPIGEEMPPRIRNNSAPPSPTLPPYAELGGIVGVECSPPPDLFERSVFPHPNAPSRAAGGRLGFLPFFSRAGGAATSCGGDRCAPNLIEELFGPAISHSRTEPLQRTYLRQLDLKVSRQQQQLQAWPRPFDYLVSHLALVAKSLRQSYSLEAFRLIHDEQLCVRLPKNDHAWQATTAATETLPYQLLVFAIEAWLMLDLSPVLDIDGSTPLPLAMIGSDRIEDLVRPLLPAPAPGERLQNCKLAPTEVTAAQLRGWKNMTFVWTSEISEHLSVNLDGGRKEIKIYAHVAYCQLHAAAGEGSSLYKMGFRHYQRVLIEIAHTYRLLFAGDEDSRRVFTEMGMAAGNAGFENIFFLDPEGTKPRDLYYLATDFPVFGERLVRLQDLLLRGKGLRAMWRDDRETLVWWSFWYVCLLLPPFIPHAREAFLHR
ncbi:hypothetical protein FN846DRAFT_474226 [Sphaerosporella brunnea]|uniref:Uncharacterized protein n=1 Tax=Sphaerosporella brunnea TaxID=1250544 RepID=A0A5J5EDY1_9PEZI|nr:hypothetical protein FN846DRAFT_474226 [Sphaerosporella brunnea]